MTSPAPRVSVVIPAHNAAGTLEATFASLVAQSVPDWEAVLVDDGSTDTTAGLAEALARSDTRLRVLRQARGGASAARNTGLAAARADWVLFLDADDEIAPRYFARMLGRLGRNSGAAAAYCMSRRLMATGKSPLVQWTSGLADPAVAFPLFARFNPVAIHAVLVRRALVLELGGFDLSLRTCEEWDLWQRLARTGARWAAVPEVLAFYRARAGSLTSDAGCMLADAAVVIGRAHRPDPRVASPDPRFAGGLPEEDAEAHVACFACWCAAMEAGKGRDGAAALAPLGRLPPLDVHTTGAMLVDGFCIGAGIPSTRLLRAWDVVGAPLEALCDRLGAASPQPAFGARLVSAVHLALLRGDELREPVVLANKLGVRRDLCLPRPVEVPAGVDTLVLHLTVGRKAAATFELPVWGSITAAGIAGLVGAELRRELWTRVGVRTAPLAYRVLGAAKARLPRVVRRGLDHARRLARGNARLGHGEGKAPAAGASGDPGEASLASCPVQARLAALRAEAAEAPPPRAHAASAPAGPAGPGRTDRRDVWENFFATPDPWNYTSPYEATKYSHSLSLLPDERIGEALELACAEGHFTAMLAPRVERLVATDIAERALERARGRLGARGGVEFRRLDLAADALPDGLDLIVCSEVLYYLRDREQLGAVARKLRDALRPGGWLLSAHAFVLTDDPDTTGFDWGHPFGAKVISAAFAGTNGFSLRRSIVTELYRVDLFRRDLPGETPASPSVERVPLDAPLTPEVERFLVWDGAVVTRAEAARRATTRVPVLMYHRVAESGPAALARYRVTPEAFAAQLRSLRRHGYHAIVSADLAHHLRLGLPFAGRPVLITFDDGYRDFHDVAWPLLRRADFRAEVFVPTAKVGGAADWDAAYGPAAPLMGWDEIETLHAQGVAFGSHLASHRPADALSSEELLREAGLSRALLERRLGCAVTAVAPPYGIGDERVNRVLAMCGYKVGFTTRPGVASLCEPPLALPRIEVRGDWDLDAFARGLGFHDDGERGNGEAPTA